MKEYVSLYSLLNSIARGYLNYEHVHLFIFYLILPGTFMIDTLHAKRI